MAPQPESTAGEWLATAEEDFAAARDLLGLGHWGPAAFYAQQSAEKALKAVQIRRERRFERTHDLLLLARSMKAGPQVEGAAAYLSRFYTAARYPDAPADVTEEDSTAALARVEEVLRWARTQLS